MSDYLAGNNLGTLLVRALDDETYMSEPGPALMATLLAIVIRAERWVQYADAPLEQHGDSPVVRKALERFTFSL